jgi:hypothetical protein
MNSIAHRAQDLYSWLDQEHTRAYNEDRERHPWPPRDPRVPCSNPDCPRLCEGPYCSPACEAADNAAIEDMAQRWEAQMRYEGCQRTRYCASRETNATVLLGKRTLADQQRTADEAKGGLVALACGRREHNTGAHDAPRKACGMTKDDLLAQLRWIKDTLSGDQEAAHIEADRALLAYIGDHKVHDAYDAIDKWYA